MIERIDAGERELSIPIEIDFEPTGEPVSR